MRVKLVKTGIGVAVMLASAASAWAADGVLLAQRVTIGTSQQTQQIQIVKDRVHAEMATANGAKQAIIFDAAKQIVYILNVDRKTYSELTKAQVDQLGGAVQDMMGQMQAAMASMSPERRARWKP